MYIVFYSKALALLLVCYEMVRDIFQGSVRTDKQMSKFSLFKLYSSLYYVMQTSL